MLQRVRSTMLLKAYILLKPIKSFTFLFALRISRGFFYEYLMWNVLQDVSNFFYKIDEIFYKHLTKDIIEDILNRTFQNCLFSL